MKAERASVPTMIQFPGTLGQYELLGAIARGGMATVYLARRRGEAGFQRLFAVKVMHAHLADDEEFVSMMLDEARIAARLHHPNVVPIVDLGSDGGTHYVVMEYVEGCSLGALLKKFPDQRPPRLLISVMLDVLAGLHAAHTLVDDDGNPMNLVHRDVSPQNVMVGIDGTARLTDFGIARAASRIMSTRPGQLKGKIAFMSPEQIQFPDQIDRRSDLFSAGAMLWSALTARRLFLGESDAATLSNILNLAIPAASDIGLKPPRELDAFLAKALDRSRDTRFQSAEEMEEALREAAASASAVGSRREVAAWVHAGFGDELKARRRAVSQAKGNPTTASSPFATDLRMLQATEHTPSRSGLYAQMTPPFTLASGLEVPALTGIAPEGQTPAPQPKGAGISNRALAAAGAIGLLALVAILFAAVALTRRPGAAPEAKAAEKPAVVTPVAQPAAVTPPPVAPAPTTTMAAADTAAAPSEPPARAAKPSRAAPRAAAPAKGEPAPAAAGKTTPAPTSAPTPSEPPKKAARWDSDSPLPPQ